MRDARDAFDGAGQSAAEQIIQALANPEALPDDVAASTRRRRRRSAVRTGTACVAVVAVAASALTLRPAPPLPNIAVADGTVGEARIVNLDERVGGNYCDTSLSPEPYAPLGEPGVVIANEDVREQGIDISARLIEWEWSEEPTSTEVELDGVIDLTGDPENNESLVAAVMTVSWDGAALYDVDAATFMVSGGRLLSATASWPFDPLALEAGLWVTDSPVPVYDADADRSSITYTSPIEPSCLGEFGASSRYPYRAPDLPATLHSFVQVRDEDGVPLVTNVDAVGFDGTTVAFPGFEEADLTASLEPALPEEIAEAEEAVVREFAQEPRRSPAAHIRDLVAETGEPLQEETTGARLARGCVADADAVASEGPHLRVVASEDAAATLPEKLPVGAVAGGEQWSGLDEEQESPEEVTYWSQQGFIVFLDDATGDLIAVAPIQADFTDGSVGQTMELIGIANPLGSTCGDWPLPAAGTYRALLALPYEGAQVEGLESDGYGYLTTWTDAGEITLVD